MKSNIRKVLSASLFALALGAGGANAMVEEVGTSMNTGNARVDRDITIDSSTRWINVTYGETVRITASGGAADVQTVFQILPIPASKITEYTIEIDGQVLRYRNTQAQWTDFVWPNQQGTPGARILATTFDGRTVEIANFPGRFGLEKLINSAQRKRKDNGAFELTWSNSVNAVAVDLKIISSPQVAASTAPAAPSRGYKGLRLPAVVTAGPALVTAVAADAPNNVAPVVGGGAK